MMIIWWQVVVLVDDYDYDYDSGGVGGGIG